jgi:cysteine desulfuration protein SufE
MLTPQDVIDNFELLDDWESRYAYLADLGEALPPLEETLRTENNRVQGCVSKVWVHARPDTGDPGRLSYFGDCDTAIIKGVLALLIEMMSGRTPSEIEALDVERLFEKLQLAEHLSPNRHFGIYAIVEAMKAQARDAALQDRAASS